MQIKIDKPIQGSEMVANRMVVNTSHGGYVGLMVFPDFWLRCLFADELIRASIRSGGRFVKEQNRVVFDNGAKILMMVIEKDSDVTRVAGYQFQDVAVFSPERYSNDVLNVLHAYNRCGKDFQPIWMEVVL